MDRAEAADSASARDLNRLYDQTVPEMGFREYWHPICLAREIGARPLAVKPLGLPVALVRRNGKLFAVADECPHRGTPLSLGRHVFPGTNTITCCYHGFTYDLASGGCVGVLSDGPESPMVGKLRVRTYPVAECQGIVWIWTGEGAPVPLEEDVPFGLRSATVVRVLRRSVYGNWRWHIENTGNGHAFVLHRTSLYAQLRRFPGFATSCKPQLMVQGEDGEWLVDLGEIGWDADYPGLGRWPQRRKFLEGVMRDKFTPILGIRTQASLRLPCVTRVTHFPINDSLYYEWYVQTDPDHYLYFQISCGYGRSLAERAWFLARYYAWGRAVGLLGFNGQDTMVVGRSHDFVKRHGRWNPPSRLCRTDGFQLAWREYALKRARGVAPGAAAESNGAAGVAG